MKLRWHVTKPTQDPTPKSLALHAGRSQAGRGGKFLSELGRALGGEANL